LGTLAIIVLQSLAAPVISVLVLIGATYLHGAAFTDAYVALAIISGLTSFMLFRPHTSTNWSSFVSRWTLLRRVMISWIALVCILLLIGYATKASVIFSRRVLFTWGLATPVLVAGVLLVLRQWLRQSIVRSGSTRSTVIAGVSDVSRRLAASIRERPELGLVLEGFFDDRAEDRVGALEGGKLLGRLSDLPAYCRKNGVDSIFIAVPLSNAERTSSILDELGDTTASVYFVPDIFVFDLIQARTDDLNGIPVVALCETPFHGGSGVLKRLSDIVLASLLLLMTLPVMLLVAAAIKLTSPGSIIFKQRRYGLDGEEFMVYKFRTMTVSEDGDEVRQATRNDSRVTPLGQFLRRYSLDELPQLINVLQGRMSVVGPRPHAVAHNETYRGLIEGYMIRHKVAPGITGLAQVNGCRGETASVEEMKKRVHYDLEYLRHWSLGLDLKIILRTLTVWMQDDKAY
jgi:putative colanic acid biosynthesis UDP-glucose lipid carrier transferase